MIGGRARVFVTMTTRDTAPPARWGAVWFHVVRNQLFFTSLSCDCPIPFTYTTLPCSSSPIAPLRARFVNATHWRCAATPLAPKNFPRGRVRVLRGPPPSSSRLSWRCGSAPEYQLDDSTSFRPRSRRLPYPINVSGVGGHSPSRAPPSPSAAL